MRGRRPSGPEYVEQLEGSALAKERLRIVLQTLAGEYRVQEACQLLGICVQRFDQLRRQALQAAVHDMESKPIGRPRQEESVGPDDVSALRHRLAEVEAELQASRVREEIALVLPRVAPSPSDTEKNGIPAEVFPAVVSPRRLLHGAARPDNGGDGCVKRRHDAGWRTSVAELRIAEAPWPERPAC